MNKRIQHFQKAFFIGLFLLISQLSVGQFVKYSDGYIILKSGEKIEGQIKTSSAVHKAREIIFIFADGSKLRYHADDLQEYKIGNDLHISAKIPHHRKEVFLKEVITKYNVIFVYYYYHKPAKNSTTNACEIIIYGDDYVSENNGKKVGSKTFKKENNKWILLNQCEDSSTTNIIKN